MSAPTSGRETFWRQNPNTEKWHAFEGGEPWSVCAYTCRGGPAHSAVPEGGSPCLLCCDALGLKRPEQSHQPVVEPEDMKVEFVGGRFDGMWIYLSVVSEGPTRLRVLPRQYTKKFEPPRPPGVERPQKAPWES